MAQIKAICGNWKNATVQQWWLESVTTVHEQDDHINNYSDFTLPLLPLALDCNTYYRFSHSSLVARPEGMMCICCAVFSNSCLLAGTTLGLNFKMERKMFLHSLILNRLSTKITGMMNKCKKINVTILSILISYCVSRPFKHVVDLF